MTTLLEKYYRGISQQLRSEVDFINTLFHHQGVKGAGNEAVLRELLTKFIPGRYGVGTGVVIDRLEKQSHQCDIVIYDKLHYPSLLSLTSAHLFPVDIVYATIEVKTTLTATCAKQALDNIRSVSTLSILPKDFMTSGSSGGEFKVTSHKPSPPLGVIFGYDSDASKFETFRNWFLPAPEDSSSGNFLVGCLDQGLIQCYRDAEGQRRCDGVALPVLNAAGQMLEVFSPVESVEYEGVLHPVKEATGHYFAIDQARALLFFVLALTESMATKFINPELRFSEHYIPGASKTGISVV